jgi:hypothetical protein
VIIDNKIIIGVNEKKKHQIIREDIESGRPFETVAEHGSEVLALLANPDLDILWAVDSFSNIFQYGLGKIDEKKIQAKYSGLGIGEVRCLTRFGNLLFAGGNDHKVCVINTADKEVLPEIIETAIKNIYSLQICQVSPSETYLAIIGTDSSYSSGKTDIFDISKFQEISTINTIFSNPRFHINALSGQFNANIIDSSSTLKESANGNSGELQKNLNEVTQQYKTSKEGNKRKRSCYIF